MEAEQKLAALEEAILHEKRMAAREVYHEAWADGMLEGIDSDILAEIAISTALEETVGEEGEDAAIALLDRLRDRIVTGDFNLAKTLQ